MSHAVSEARIDMPASVDVVKEQPVAAKQATITRGRNKYLIAELRDRQASRPPRRRLGRVPEMQRQRPSGSLQFAHGTQLND